MNAKKPSLWGWGPADRDACQEHVEIGVTEKKLECAEQDVNIQLEQKCQEFKQLLLELGSKGRALEDEGQADQYAQ